MFVCYCCFFCKSLNLLLLSIFHFVPVWLFQVKIWFQNRRNKWKRQLAAEMEAANMSAQRSPHRMVRVPVLYHDSGVAFPPSSGRPERLPGSSSPPTLSSSLGTLCYPHPYPHMSTLRSLHGAVWRQGSKESKGYLVKRGRLTRFPDTRTNPSVVISFPTLLNGAARL